MGRNDDRGLIGLLSIPQPEVLEDLADDGRIFDKGEYPKRK